MPHGIVTPGQVTGQVAQPDQQQAVQQQAVQQQPAQQQPAQWPVQQPAKKRHSKPSSSGAPRYQNCFILYREHWDPIVRAENPHLTSVGDICKFENLSKEPIHELRDNDASANNRIFTAKIIGAMWSNVDETEKDLWRRMSAQAKIDHGTKFPGYKFKPRASASIPRRRPAGQAQARPKPRSTQTKKATRTGSKKAQPANASTQVASPASAPVMIQPAIPFAPQPTQPEIPNESAAQEEDLVFDEDLAMYFDFESYNFDQSLQQQDQQQVQQQVQESQDVNMKLLEGMADMQMTEDSNQDSPYPLGPLL